MRNNPRKVSGIEKNSHPRQTQVKKRKTKVLDTYSSASKKQKDSANDQPFFLVNLQPVNDHGEKRVGEHRKMIKSEISSRPCPRLKSGTGV